MYGKTYRYRCRYKLMALLLSLIMMVAMLTLPAAAQVNDWAEHWAGKVITDWLQQGKVNGYSDNSFKPDKPITRAEFMVMTNQAFGFEEVKAGTIYFNDVKKSDWFAGAVQKAVAAGYISGYPNGEIKPNQTISRQEAAVIINKISQLTPEPELVANFADAAQIPEWSRGYIGAVAQANYMKGYPDGSFKPLEAISRAEALITFNNVLNSAYVPALTYDKAGTYGPTEGMEVIAGDVIVKADGVTLQNLNIKGDLIVAEEVGNGTVTFNNLIVEGESIFRGGGKNSIHINGGQYNSITIEKTSSGELRVVATNAEGINIVVAQEAAGDTVILEGVFASVQVQASGVQIQTQAQTVIAELVVAPAAENTKINLNTTTTVDKIVLESTAAIQGQGTIKTAEVKANNVSFENPPQQQTVAPSVTAPPTSTPPANTGGGVSSGSGGGGGSPAVAVTLTVPAAGAIPWHVDALVTNTQTGAAITDLQLADFTLSQNRVNIPLGMVNHDERNDQPGRYTIYPDQWVDCPVIGYSVRLPVGSYTLALNKSGYVPTSVDFAIGWVVVDPRATNINITGTPRVGETLTGSYSFNANDAGDLEQGSTFKWYTNASRDDQDYISVSDAISKTYTVQASDLGKYIKFEVTPKDAAGHTGAAAYSTPVGPITAAVAENKITSAAVTIEQGSIVFEFDLKDGAADINYAAAHEAPYYLDKTNSTVTLKSGANQVTKTLAQLSIPADGRLSYTDLDTLIATWWSNPALAFVPSEIELNIQPQSESAAKWTTLNVSRSLQAAEVSLLTPSAPGGIDTNLNIIWARPDSILISVYASIAGQDTGISAVSITDFYLVKDLFTSPAEQTGITLYIDPLGGTWEYEILPPAGTSFANGSYRLAFSRAGYQTEHVDFSLASITDFANTVKTDSVASFTWTPISADCTVLVQQSTDGGNVWSYANHITTPPPGLHSTTVQGLTPNTSYLFRLEIQGAPPSYSNQVAVTTNPAP